MPVGSPETWEFTDYKEFELPERKQVIDLSLEFDKEKPGLDKAVSICIDAYQRGDISKSEFGYRMGNQFVDNIRAVGLDKQPPERVIAAMRYIRSVHEYYKQILGEREYLIMRNGFISEYGVGSALLRDAGTTVLENADPNKAKTQDMINKVDLFVDLSDGGNNDRILALQVKCLSVNEDIPEKIIPVNSEDDIDRCIVGPYSYAIKKQVMFMNNGSAMLQYCRSFTNAKVQPVYVLLPALGGEYSRVNPITGEPDRRLGADLYAEIEEKFGEE